MMPSLLLKTCWPTNSGKPHSAVKHLAGVLAADPQASPIQAGEIITTGTVTRAFPVAAGETWWTEVEGIEVRPMRLTFA